MEIDLKDDYIRLNKLDHNKLHELVDKNLWVYDTGEDHFKKLYFYTFNSSDFNYKDISVDFLFSIEGPSATLREGRHTFFRDEGYIFYLNKKHMLAALDYCSKYFDLD